LNHLKTEIDVLINLFENQPVNLPETEEPPTKLKQGDRVQIANKGKYRATEGTVLKINPVTKHVSIALDDSNRTSHHIKNLKLIPAERVSINK